MMKVLGVDPGLSGGLAWINDEGELMTMPMPVSETAKGRELDEGRLVSLCAEFRPEVTIIEKVNAWPGQGVVSMFTFGVVWGILRGVLAGRQIPYQLVRPQEWQKAIMVGNPKGSEYLVASRLWPSHDFKASERCKKPHDGMVDAALIAQYGWRQNHVR